jgi:uncharacterized protein YndB with AHSA1/START domain
MAELRSIEIRRLFRASPERVFEAFQNPALLREWSAPGEHRNERVEVDFRVGGRYRREMRFPDGSLQVLSGTYREIDPPRRLVYTYVWETLSVAETLVEIELTPRGSETELRLVHSGFDDAAFAANHERGWGDCFDQLARVCAEAKRP